MKRETESVLFLLPEAKSTQTARSAKFSEHMKRANALFSMVTTRKQGPQAPVFLTRSAKIRPSPVCEIFRAELSPELFRFSALELRFSSDHLIP